MSDWDSDSVFPRDRTGRDSEIRNSVRKGKVVEAWAEEGAGAFARVQYLDLGGLISEPLPIKVPYASGTTRFHLPKVGSDVSVTMFSNGDDSDGCIDGAFYNTGNPVPVTDPNLDHTRYPDGTIIQYDEGTSTYLIDAKGLVNITTTDNVIINGVNITVTGSGQVVITAPNIILRGDVAIDGNLAVDGNVSNTGDMQTDGAHRDRIGGHV
jgi:phage baseplate assembly protein V